MWTSPPLSSRLDQPVSCHRLFSVFKLIFTTTFMATIVQETNRYVRHVLGDAADSKWVDVTVEDICEFLGFALLMGINKLPQLHQYWNTDPAYRYLHIAERIPRDRFFAIRRFHHFTARHCHHHPLHPSHQHPHHPRHDPRQIPHVP